MTDMRPRDKLNNFYLHFFETYCYHTWQGATLWEEIQLANACVVTDFSLLLRLQVTEKVFKVISVSCCYRHVWSRLGILHWTNKQIIMYMFWNVCNHNMPRALKMNSYNEFKQGHVKYYPSATKNLYHHSAYGYQTWHGSYLQRGGPTYKIKWPFD